MRLFTKIIYIVIIIFLFTSCDDRLQTMSLDKYAKTVFNLPLDLKTDNIISEFRNFGEEENMGSGIIVLELKSQKSKDFVKHIPWLEPILQSIDPKKNKFNEMYEIKPVLFDVQNQIAEIWYSQNVSNSLEFKYYVKDYQLNDLYYYKEFTTNEFGHQKKKVLLFDKKRNILFLIFHVK